MYCNKCGKKFEENFSFCLTCGNPLQVELTYKNLSNKWVWMLTIIPTVILLIVPIFGIYPNLDYKYSVTNNHLYYEYIWYPVIFLCISLIVTAILVFIDSRELKRNGIIGNWWITGFLLIPVYLFLRASKTNKNYYYTICWFVLFLFYLFIYFYFAILGN